VTSPARAISELFRRQRQPRRRPRRLRPRFRPPALLPRRPRRRLDLRREGDVPPGGVRVRSLRPGRFQDPRVDFSADTLASDVTSERALHRHRGSLLLRRGCLSRLFNLDASGRRFRFPKHRRRVPRHPRGGRSAAGDLREREVIDGIREAPRDVFQHLSLPTFLRSLLAGPPARLGFLLGVRGRREGRRRGGL